MRGIRRIAVTGVAVVAMMGMGVGVASAQTKFSVEVGGVYIAGHASGSLTKASGGFEAYDDEAVDHEPRFDYISGKVYCYSEDLDEGTAVFGADITKGDITDKYILFWLDDGGQSGDQLEYEIYDQKVPCTTAAPGDPVDIDEGGYITIK